MMHGRGKWDFGQGQNSWRYDFTIPRTTRVRFILGMSPPEDLDGLSHAELKGLVVKQWEEMVELQRMVAALRDEIARLKGGPGRPNIKPSGMEQATEPKPPGSSGDQAADGAARGRSCRSTRNGPSKSPHRRAAPASKATRASWCRIW